MVFWMPPLSLETSESSSQKVMPKHIKTWLMSSQQDSHVSPSQLQEKDLEKTTQETCGQPQSSAFASYDHDTASWRTSQACLFTTTLSEYSGTWPKAGMTCAGRAYPLPPVGLRISAIDSGSSPRLPTPRLWQTPVSDDAVNRKKGKINSRGEPKLSAQVLRWPTPTATERSGINPKTGKGAGLSKAAGGALNPTWVAWLMGWPLGWTDLKPLEMDKYHKWLKQHGSC